MLSQINALWEDYETDPVRLMHWLKNAPTLGPLRRIGLDIEKGQPMDDEDMEDLISICKLLGFEAVLIKVVLKEQIMVEALCEDLARKVSLVYERQNIRDLNSHTHGMLALGQIHQEEHYCWAEHLFHADHLYTYE